MCGPDISSVVDLYAVPIWSNLMTNHESSVKLSKCNFNHRFHFIALADRFKASNQAVLTASLLEQAFLFWASVWHQLWKRQQLSGGRIQSWKNALRPQVQAKQLLSYPAFESHQDLRFLDIKKCWSCCRIGAESGYTMGAEGDGSFDLSTHAASNKSMAWLDEAGRKPSISLRLWIIFCWMNSFMNAFLGSSMGVETSVPLKLWASQMQTMKTAFSNASSWRNSKWIWLPQVGLPWPPSLLVSMDYAAQMQVRVPGSCLLIIYGWHVNLERKASAVCRLWLPWAAGSPSAHWGYPPPATAPPGVAPHAPGPITPVSRSSGSDTTLPWRMASVELPRNQRRWMCVLNQVGSIRELLLVLLPLQVT